MVSLDLGASVGRSRTLGARLSYETDLDTGIQAIEVGAAAAMEEVVVAVFGGDKPESALGDELLDGSRHCVDLLSRTYCLALSRPVRAGPTASAPRWVQYRVTQTTSGSNPHPTLPRKRGREKARTLSRTRGREKARTLSRTRGREIFLGEGFDDHHEDDGEGDHGADDAVDPGLPRQLLVGWRRLARRLERLDLPRRHPRVESDGDHDQDHEEDQGGDNPAPQPPVPDRDQGQAGQQEEAVGGVRHPVIEELDPLQGE